MRNVLAKEGAEVLCLQETKATRLLNVRCFSIWGDNKVGWVHKKGTNGTGSTFIMWHKEAFYCDSHVEGRDFIAIFGQHLKSKLKCAVVNVYANFNLNEAASWEDLSNIRSANQEWAWWFCGDFNAVRRVSERKGIREKGSQTNEIRGFNSFIERNFLVEFPIVGMKYTWFRANG